MTTPSAKVVCDSISLAGVRLTTMEVCMHRFVLAEFNTHRVFSRNSASSRAIPISKRIFSVTTDLAWPLEWGSNQKGMQAGAQLKGWRLWLSKLVWRTASYSACVFASLLEKLGLHKQITNRLLEPFLWHTAVVSSTEWKNFFDQRISPLAQPEIRALAVEMSMALGSSRPKIVRVGEYHLPYISYTELQSLSPSQQIKVSVARCARVSYLTQDGRRDIEEDVKLYDRLVSAKPPHASPLEHAATPIVPYAHTEDQTGNFEGWAQARHSPALKL